MHINTMIHNFLLSIIQDSKAKEQMWSTLKLTNI
jgi:hypothetical protein